MFRNITFIDVKNLFDRHVLKWPRYYGIYQNPSLVGLIINSEFEWLSNQVLMEVEKIGHFNASIIMFEV
jgi:hypothetical protein